MSPGVVIVICAALASFVSLALGYLGFIERTTRLKIPPTPPKRNEALEAHVEELDRTLTALLIANPKLLDSLPDESLMKKTLRWRRP